MARKKTFKVSANKTTYIQGDHELYQAVPLKNNIRDLTL